MLRDRNSKVAGGKGVSMSFEVSRDGSLSVNFYTNEEVNTDQFNPKNCIERTYFGADLEKALDGWNGFDGDAGLMKECKAALSELQSKVGEEILEYYSLNKKGYLAVVFRNKDRVVMGYINQTHLSSKEQLESSSGTQIDKFWRTPFKNYSGPGLVKLQSSTGIAQYQCDHFPGLSRAVHARCEEEMTYQDHLEQDLVFKDADFQ